MKHFYLRKSRRSAVPPTEMPPERVLTPEKETRETSDDQTAVITRTHDNAFALGKELIHELSADLRQGELGDLDAIWEMLSYHISVVNVTNLALKRNATSAAPIAEARDPAVAEYLMSARFLAECSAYLLADPNGWERVHIVAGLALGGNRYTLSQMDKVPMSHQSRTGAKLEQEAFTRAMITLSQWGEALHGLFHSHPGESVAATLPSLDKDIPTHQRLENGGYPLIGAVFVPGYVRFFSAERPFTITIYGTGVTPVPGETHVYKIQSPTISRRVSYETLAGS